MALGKHLRAHHDAGVAALNFLQLGSELCIAARGIAIDTVKRYVWEELGEAFFSTLGAHTHR